jgi:hypothetical protein
VRECIRACFEERRFFDRAAFTALQEDIATAILPPVKVLTSLDAMPIPQPSAPTRTAGAQPTTPALTTGAPEASLVVVPKPPAPSAPRDGRSTLDSTDLFASHQTSVPVSRPAVAAPAPPQDAFDDFFASRAATVPQQQRVTDDPFGPMTSSTAAPQRTAPAANSLDFFLTDINKAIIKIATKNKLTKIRLPMQKDIESALRKHKKIDSVDFRSFFYQIKIDSAIIGSF